MRISIISGGYTYSEEIAKVTPPKENTEAPASSQVQESFEDKLSRLKGELTDQLSKIKETRSKSVGAPAELISYTGRIPALSITPSTDKIIVGQTPEGYESIAPAELQSIFKEASETYGIDQKLLELIGYHESRFISTATSKSGAMGIMQLMPGTARDMGVEHPYDVYENIMGGAKLLRQLSDTFSGDLDLILSGYSAGAGAVKKYGGIPPYDETVNYVAWIRERYP